jgi:hypothetical protein
MATRPMTTLHKLLAAAVTTTLFVAASAPGQAQRYTPAGKPCGDYYGSEYSYECVEGRFESISKHICAYRTGPPCPPARAPSKRR